MELCLIIGKPFLCKNLYEEEEKMQNDVEKIVISIKGSGENNDGESAWALDIDCVSSQNNKKKGSSYEMEMYAVLNALRVVKSVSIPAEIRTNNEVIAQICQEMHEGKRCRAEAYLELWNDIEKEMKILDSKALKFVFKPKNEKDDNLKKAGKIAHDRKIE